MIPITSSILNFILILAGFSRIKFNFKGEHVSPMELKNNVYDFYYSVLENKYFNTL